MQENDLPVVADFSEKSTHCMIQRVITVKSFRSAFPKLQLLMLKVWTIGWGGLSLVSAAKLETVLLGLIGLTTAFFF